MQPGSKKQYKVIVNLFYDMTLAGKYLISAKFFVGRDLTNPFDERVPIQSNVTSVVVAPYMPHN